MKEQSWQQLPHPSYQKNRIRKANKKDVQIIVQNLIRKRQEHEARIDKLLTHNYRSQDVTQESFKNHQDQISQILKQLDREDRIPKEEMHLSVGALSNHVNLLATVSLKTQYYLIEPPLQQHKQQGFLHQSLTKLLGNCRMTLKFVDQQQPDSISQIFRQTADYLKAQSLNDGLFVQIQSESKKQSEQFYGTRFYLGKYQQIQLSKQTLKQEEQSLIVVKTQQNAKIVNISWLLLQRLLLVKQNCIYPETLNILFSYPIKTFLIRQSMQLLSFNELIGNFARSEDEKAPLTIQRLKVFGIEQKSGCSYEIENLSKSKNIKHYSSILNQFNKLVLIVEEQLPVKHIPLSCLQNHFVVVTMTIKTSGRYFLSIGSASDMQQFRIYVIDIEGNVIYGQFVNNGEFLFCSLKQESYQVYISPIPNKAAEKGLQESFQLVKDHQEQFSLWIQGKSVFSKQGDANFQIRLKQEYNVFTMTIANNYIKNHQNITHLQQDDCLIVRRQCIGGLGLFVDTFCFNKPANLTVTYKGAYNLADQYFQSNQISITSGKSLCLYQNADIESIVMENKGSEEVLKYRLVTFYI